MARTRSEVPKQPARLTPVEMQAGIERLHRRLEEVKQFDPRSVTEQYNIPHVEKITAAVDDALVRTFGGDSLDYERYQEAAHFNNGPHNYAYEVPLHEVQQSLGRSKNRSIALLEQAIESLRERLAEAGPSAAEHSSPATELHFIADTRLAELRKLVSAQFDFKKLIRLCEEINTAYSEGCYFATAMLTRGLLDHVPPVFGFKSFSEVANNYGGGGRSFKETMHHLENATRKVADAHLHMPIRKSETLPVAQQVNCAAQLDVLLSEIVRISQ
jgi:hypothetical protein